MAAAVATPSTGLPLAVVLPAALIFGVLVVVAIRSTVASARGTAGRVALAVAIGLLVGELAAMTLFSNAISQRMDTEAAARADVSVSGTDDAPSRLQRAERAEVAEDAAVDAGERAESVERVQEAAEEAAERDASRVPAPGTGLFFGDEEAVTRHIEDETGKGE